MIINSAFVADDHHSTLEGIAGILRDEFGCPEIATFSNLSLAKKEIAGREYDIYILDLEFKNEKAFDLIRLVRKRYPHARIIIHTMHEELSYVDELLSYDVNGIIFKASPRKYILLTITEVMNGKKSVCPRTKELEQLYAEERKIKKGKYLSLTPAELRIAGILIYGYTNKEIGEMLFLSEETVDTHRKNIALKMNTTNPSSLAAKLVHYGIVPYDEKKMKGREKKNES